MNYSWLQISGDTVKIAGGHFVKHDGYCQRLQVLFNVLYKIRSQIRHLRLEFTDGEPASFVGLDLLIKQILEQIQPETFVVVTNEFDYSNPAVTMEYFKTPFITDTQRVYVDHSQQLDSDACMFGAVFGRFSMERFLLAAHLGQHTNSMIIFQPNKQWVEFNFDGAEDLYAKELEWFNRYQLPSVALNHHHNGCVHWQESVENMEQIWSKYAIEIVAETNPHNRYWVTEKTTKCLISGKPFLLLAGCGSLEYLKQLGFQTFSSVVNEEYDQEPNINVRLEMICNEISRLSQNYDVETLTQLLQTQTEYNRQNYKSIAKSFVRNNDLVH